MPGRQNFGDMTVMRHAPLHRASPCAHYGSWPLNSTTCLGCIAAANFAGKSDTEARLHAARELTHMRERLEVIRAFLILAWELKAISHHALADLSASLDELGKQATRWSQWFERGEDKA